MTKKLSRKVSYRPKNSSQRATLDLTPENLLQQEELHFQKVSGEFNPFAVTEKILSLDYSWQDPDRSSNFLVFPSGEALQNFLENRASKWQNSYPFVLLIQVSANEIYLNQFADPETYKLPTKTIIEWIMSHHECTIRNEHNTLITSSPKI